MKLNRQTCLQLSDFLYSWLSVGLGLFLLSEAICPGFAQPYIILIFGCFFGRLVLFWKCF